METNNAVSCFGLSQEEAAPDEPSSHVVSPPKRPRRSLDDLNEEEVKITPRGNYATFP